jgi:Permuted papain-like amidase enzyme, YaeF/YiiX, C92 family
MGNVVLSWLGKRIASYLTKEIPGYEPSTPPDFASLERAIQPGDVLLIEGNTRIASVIKYLTQSTWSHSAMYVGPIDGRATKDGEAHVLVEATPVEGVVSAPLSKYRFSHVRICRAHALTPQDRAAVVRHVTDRIGLVYDNRNVLDLMRYLVPLPVPARFRRRALALGSGSPTQAICSTLIAQAFQLVRYPILQRVKRPDDDRKVKSQFSRDEILLIRHYSLYTPRDFDISPYFAIVKPTLETGFDYKRFSWGEDRVIAAVA